jgi:secreted trypsin-like serine protease
MRKKFGISVAVVAAAVLGTAVPAGAVTDGSPDDGAHPYVGLMVADDAAGTPMWRCSGTLVSPTVFVTAGHCTFGAARATIWFEENIQGNEAALGYPRGGATSHDGDVYTHPQYDDNAFFLYDLGVVELDEPVEMPAYGALPALDQLDVLKPRASTTFTSVGYGLQVSFSNPNPPKFSALKDRLVATPHLTQINGGIAGDYAMVLSNNARTGGTCFGDSGGPNFLGDSHVIAGVTSFGLNSSCGGTGGVYRIDRADDLAFLHTFLD